MTLSMSMVLLAERTASIRQPTQRLRALRRTPSAERTIRSTAGCGEGVVAEADAVEFAQDEVAHGVGPEAFGDDGVGDAAFDVVVDAEVEGGEQVGPADEDEVVVFGEVLEERAATCAGWPGP